MNNNLFDSNILIVDKGGNTIQLNSKELYVIAFPHSYDGIKSLSDILNTRPDYALIHNENIQELNDTIKAFLDHTDNFL